MGNSNVVASCKRNLPLNERDCSAFVIAVARDFGIMLTGQANDIFKALDKGSVPGGTINYGFGMVGALRAAKAAADDQVIVIGASYNPNGNGHVAVIVGTDTAGHVRVYCGKLLKPNEASQASYNDRITSKAWANFKLTYPYIAAEPPFFFGIPIRVPFIA